METVYRRDRASQRLRIDRHNPLRRWDARNHREAVSFNDFLRQVIGYDYPTYPWEKDNYHIRPEYKDFVRELLPRIRQQGEGEQ